VPAVRRVELGDLSTTHVRCAQVIRLGPGTLAFNWAASRTLKEVRRLMPELSPELRTLQARLAAHESWGHTEDRTARTANARKAFRDRFLTEAGGDPKRAESLRRAFYARLALKSALARRRRGGDVA
jgi:hypothetical protein